MSDFGTPNYHNLRLRKLSKDSELAMPGELIPNKIIYYKLGSSINSGGGGCLYHGIDPQTRNQVAIKKGHNLNRLEGVGICTIREIKFLEEIQYFNCPYIVRLYDTFSAEGYLYMVLNYCPYSLSQYIQAYKMHNKYIPLVYVKTILYMLLKGILCLHEHRIVHKDIKPENILITSSGVVNICDFGSAQFVSDQHNYAFHKDSLDETHNHVTSSESNVKDTQPHDSLSVQSNSISKEHLSCYAESYTNRLSTETYQHTVYPHTAIPTPCYAAPELFYNISTPLPSLDMWSIGCVFIEMMTNKQFIHPGSELNILTQISTYCGDLSFELYNSPTKTCLSYPLQFTQSHVTSIQTLLASNQLTKNGYNLLSLLLQKDPNRRITAQEALNHSFFKEEPCPLSSLPVDKYMLLDPPLINSQHTSLNDSLDSTLQSHFFSPIKGQRLSFSPATTGDTSLLSTSILSPVNTPLKSYKPRLIHFD